MKPSTKRQEELSMMFKDEKDANQQLSTMLELHPEYKRKVSGCTTWRAWEIVEAAIGESFNIPNRVYDKRPRCQVCRINDSLFLGVSMLDNEEKFMCENCAKKHQMRLGPCSGVEITVLERGRK